MKKKLFWSMFAFVIVLFVHAAYSIIEAKKISELWAETNQPGYISQYFRNNDYLIGASYALAVGFSIYAILRFADTRRRTGLTGILGGITITGALYVGGCFLLGCCGSPMLAVYLSLFGSWFLGFTKPLTFILTLSSVLFGFFWIERKSKAETKCCEGDEC